MQNTQKKVRTGKILLIIAAVLIVAVIAIGLIYRNEVKTIGSIEKEDEYGF